MKTIVLTGGGTIGHCAPHFAILKHLKNHFNNIYYIGSKNGIEKSFVQSYNLPYYEIDPVKLQRKFTLENAKIPFKFIKSVSDAKKILEKLKPDVIFSKGGYVGLPVTVAGHKLNIPVVIHESDLSMGLANKIATNYADHVLTTFLPTAQNIKKGIFVGSPIREELFTITKKQALKEFNISTDKKILLVMGGSSGAQAINDVVYNSLPELTKEFFVFLICGKSNLLNTTRKDFYQIEFADMKYVYPLADVCVSRAGSNTAFELLTQKIPTVFIPLPKGASRGDQIENAEYFKKLNLAEILYQQDLTPSTLINKIQSAYAQKSIFKSNIEGLNLQNSNLKIAEILAKY